MTPLRWQELEGDLAAELRVLRAIHHTHTAPTQLAEDGVLLESLADQGIGGRLWGHVGPRGHLIPWHTTAGGYPRRHARENALRVARRRLYR